MKNRCIFLLSVITVITLSFSACVSFTPGWENTKPAPAKGNASLLLQKAADLENSASSGKLVLDLIDAYKQILDVDPGNYTALWRAGNFHMLMGAAYSESVSDKKYHYEEAIKYCERAMYLNPSFKQEIDKGTALWDAVDKLDVNYIDAMGYWYTARFYYFKECLGEVGRIFNTSIVLNNNKVIARIDSLNPNWAEGGNYFSRAIYLIAAPERFGGSKQKAAQELETAIKVGPKSLVNRWGRAKYLYSLTGNKEGYISDLKWVVQQDIRNSGKLYPWNVYFQQQSAQMLTEADALFK